MMIKVIMSITLMFWASVCFSAETIESGFSNMAEQIANELYEGQKQKIAIVEFSNIDGKTTEFGQFVSEELTTRLFRTKKFEVIERQLLHRVMEEHNLNLSGMIDEKTAKKLGRILGVDAICTGTITDLWNSVRINARIISTETGTVFAAASSEIEKDAGIKRLVNKIKVSYPENEPRKSSSTPSSIKRRGDFIQNGGFTKRYVGWERSIGDVTQGSSKTEIIPFPNGRSGKALHITHEGGGSIQFAQVVDVPNADLIFSASFQASSHEGMISAFTGTGVVQIALQFMDEDDNVLGRTVLLNHVKNPFADTPLIGVPRAKKDSYKSRYLGISSGKLYKGYTIDVRKEMEDNLLGIDQETLKKVAVIIWCGATHAQAGSELWITDISLKSK